MNLRKEALKDMFNKNINDYRDQTNAMNNNRNMQLQDEQRWLNEIQDAEMEENNFHKQLRKERVQDLRFTYKEQANDKREREKNFVKF